MLLLNKGRHWCDIVRTSYSSSLQWVHKANRICPAYLYCPANRFLEELAKRFQSKPLHHIYYWRFDSFFLFINAYHECIFYRLGQDYPNEVSCRDLNGFWCCFPSTFLHLGLSFSPWLHHTLDHGVKHSYPITHCWLVCRQDRWPRSDWSS